MNVGFFNAKSGVVAMQQGLDVISNNIANVSTTGFKDIRANFSDLLYTSKKEAYPEAQTGHGVKTAKTDVMYKAGQLMTTNKPLDFAFPKDGFFALQDESGEISYTRSGAFSMSQNGENWELVSADGKKVLGKDQNPIVLDMDDSGVVVTENVIQKLGTFTFENPHGIIANADNSYLASESSGEAILNEDCPLLQCTLEMSTVDMADQMVKIIELQRAFQLNSKMVQTSDEIQSIVNNLR